MTKNQIEYLKLRESQRANLAQEDLTRLRDQRSYVINLGTLAESQRHNIASEQQAKASLDETSRHNLVGEQISGKSLEETVRHNKAGESELKRHNIAGEQYNERALQEQSRHNVAQESIGRSQVGATYANIALGYQQLGETKRSNLARENETYRSNVARETEMNRSNVAREEETYRHNTQEEYLTRYRDRNDAAYKRGQLEQGEERLTLDAWKTGIQGAETLLKAAGLLIPLF